jgi:O-antigen ligase
MKTEKKNIPKHGMWRLGFLTLLLIGLNFYEDANAMDLSLIPRLFALLVVLGLCTLALARPSLRRQMDVGILRDPLVLCYAAYAAICFGTLALALNPTAGFTDAFKTFGAFVLVTQLCLLLPGMPNWKERLLQIVVCAALASTALGFYQYVTQLGPGLHTRAAVSAVVLGSMANVNLYAGFLILLIPFCLCGAMALRGWWRVAAVIANIATACMVVLLQTRAAYLGLAGSLAIVAVLSITFAPRLGIMPRTRWLFLTTTLLAPCAIGAFILLAPESNALAARLRSMFEGGGDSSLGARLMAWKITLRMIADHFPWGVGTGNFTVRLDEYFNAQTDFRGEGTNWIYPHNDFLWVLVEQGLLGMAAFAGLFVLGAWHGFAVLRRSPSTTMDCWMAIGVLMALGTYLMNSIFDFPLARVNHQIYLAMYLATSVLLSRETRPSKAQTKITPQPRPLLWLAVPTLVILLLGISYSRAAIRQELNLSIALEAAAIEKWNASLKFVQRASTPWKTLDPFATPLAFHEATALIHLNREPEALKALEKAYKANPNRIHIINDLGSYYARAGRFREAIDLLTTTAQRYPNQIDCVENLGLCYMDSGDYATAVKVFEGIPEEKRTVSIRSKLDMARIIAEKNARRQSPEPTPLSSQTAPANP